MIHGDPFRPGILKDQYDVIIIGSGISGLTLAGLLSRQGKKILVLEKHYTAGGFTHTYQRKGYEWGTGLHYVGDVHQKEDLARRLFDFLSAGDLHWSRMPEKYDHFIFPDRRFSLVAGREQFIDSLVKNFPQEETAIFEYIKLIREVTRTLDKQSLGKVLPLFIQNLKVKNSHHYFRTTTYDVLRSITQNEKLISVLTGIWGDYALPPKQSSFGVHATIADHYMEGGNFPVGGSGQIAATFINGITSSDGQVVVNCGVKKILLHAGRAVGVECENGQVIRATSIVSSAGVDRTFSQLVSPDQVPSSYLKRIKIIPPSLGYLSLTLGLPVGPEILGHDGSNLWDFPAYDHDRNLTSYLADPFGNPPPLSYMSFACLKDPSWKSRMGDRTVIDVLGILPYEWVKKWEGTQVRKRPQDYQDLKERLAVPYFENLFKHFPQLRDKIEIAEISTPLTVKHYLNSSQGEIYGLELSPKRFEEPHLRPHTPIKNLYLTGQDILMNGVVGAMMSAVLTATVMHPLPTASQLLPLGFFDLTD